MDNKEWIVIEDGYCDTDDEGRQISPYVPIFEVYNQRTKEGFYFKTEKEADLLCNRLNELNKDKQYFLKVIFALGNYVKNEDYDRIIDAVDNIKKRILNE